MTALAHTALGTLRLSVGRHTTLEEVERAVAGCLLAKYFPDRE